MFCGLEFYFVDFRIKFLDNRFFIYLTYHNICVCNLASSSSSQFHNSIFRIEDILSITQLHCFGTFSILHSNIWLYIDKDFTKWIIWSFTFLFLMIHTTKLCCNGHICKIMITYLCTYLLLCISYIHTYCPKAITKSGSEFWKMFDCSIHQSKFKLLHSHTIFLI